MVTNTCFLICFQVDFCVPLYLLVAAPEKKTRFGLKGENISINKMVVIC